MENSGSILKALCYKRAISVALRNDNPMKSAENPTSPKFFTMSEPSATAESKGCLCVVYKGPSMNPTLMEPELMEVCPVLADKIRTGDVIFFQHPQNRTKYLVHRVVAASNGVFRTRGDNNRHTDTFSVTADQIIGVVIASWRGERRRIINGGGAGRLTSWVLVGRIYAFLIGRRLLVKPYHLLSRICSPLAQRMLRDKLQPRIIHYPAQAHWRCQLFIGNKLIGGFNAETGKWEIRRPYRLFVDIRKLPNPQ